MKNKISPVFYLFILSIILFSSTSGAQQITYSETDRNETKNTNFDIIGRFGDNVLVFKNIRNASYISVYNDNMQLVQNVDLEFMPDRLLEYDILPFAEYSYIFYQYQQRNIAYLMAVKIGIDGKPLTSPVELDTTHINYNASRRVYSVSMSNDKSKFIAFKINSKDERNLVFETNLFNSELSAIHASKINLPMIDRNDFLTDFNLDNEGNLVFGRGRRRSSEDNISQFYLIVKPANADTFSVNELQFEGISLDEVKLRIDDFNDRYLFTAFYYKGRRSGNIEGIANSVYDKKMKSWVVRNVIPLAEEIRADATSDNNLKTALNDYFIKQIVIRKDGGFILNAESMYTTSRGGGYNRWDMFGNPYMMGSPMGWGGWGMSGPGMYGNPYYGNSYNNITRYHADNVMVLAFDKDGQLILSNTIRKSQYDDQNEGMVSYQTVNTGNALHYLYNDYDKRNILLSYQSLGIDGKIKRHPPMKGMDTRIEFMPRYARQIAARSVFIPCILRNYLCFARIDFTD